MKTTQKRIPQPLGSYVIVKPKDVERKSQGGILLSYSNEDRVKGATIEGVVVAIGPLAFKDEMNPGGEPWYQVGDRVIFVKYGGKFIKCDEEDYIIFRYEDVMCKLENEVSLSDVEKDK